MIDQETVTVTAVEEVVQVTFIDGAPGVHGDALHDSTVASLVSGKVPTSELATGTPNGLKFLRDDQSWQVPAGGGGLSEPVTLTQALTLTGASGNQLVIDTNTLVVDATNNRVGIGTASPSTTLELVSGSTIRANACSILMGGSATGRRIGIVIDETAKITTRNNSAGINLYLQVKQAGNVSTDGNTAQLIKITDRSDVYIRTVTAASNASPIVITTSASHGFATGDSIVVNGVAGNTAANGIWVITSTGASTFSLNTSTGNGAYTSGGTASNRSLLYGLEIQCNPLVARGGWTGAALNGDDANCLIINNGGTAKGTDGVYFGVASGVSGSAWANVIKVDVDADTVLGASGAYTTGIDFAPTDPATFSTAAIRLGVGHNIVLDTTTGTKIGTATTQKLGFWNATPVVRSAAYTVTNVTTDRAYDANVPTLNEVADVLGTLITDLKLIGLIG